MKTSNFLAVATLAILAATSPVQAASITWNSPVTISGDNDVSTNGTLVAAHNLNGATGNATVNTVPFTGSTSSSSLGTYFSMSGFYGTSQNLYTGSATPFGGL